MLHALRPSCLLLPVLLLACGKTGTDSGPASETDADGDGYSVESDCNDADETVYPGATEVCDGVDNDCDGTADGSDATDAPTWYLDFDGDGYGSADNQRVECLQPAGHVRVASDCDDGDDEVFPGGTEVCDELDNDCDGVVDEGVQTTFYPDLDSDGYGDEASEVSACTAPSGYTEATGDCDDSDPEVNLEASESCNGIDDDCDGDIDEDDAIDATTWYYDRDGDAWGDAGLTTVACEAPAGTAAVAGDCDDLDDAISPDRSEVCDGIDNDCDGDTDEDAVDATTFYLDDDLDGYADADPSLGETACAPSAATYIEVATGDAVDCDDSDAGVNPGATEVCDAVDNDCDGVVDESDASDASTWHADVDSDGYGDADVTTTACSQPSGYVSDATDCDDSSALALPGGTEVCDNLDNDCDGTTDNSDAEGALTWYLDFDSDGYGDALRSTTGCTAPSLYVENSDDCDDTEAGVNPGATESCNGIDDDCDGTTDGSMAVDAVPFYDDGDSDGYGDASAITYACTQPTGTVTDKTDCNDRDSTVHPGATETCNGVDDDCDSATGEPTTTWYEDADLDGYGLTSSATDACFAPDTDWITVSGDCVDTDDRIFPDASEVCDGVDNNCDGVADDTTAVCYAQVSGSDVLVDTDTTCEGTRTWSGVVDLDSADSEDRCTACDYVFTLDPFDDVAWTSPSVTCTNLEPAEYDQLGIEVGLTSLTLWGLSNGTWDDLGTSVTWDESSGIGTWDGLSNGGDASLTSDIDLTFAE